MSFLNEVLVRFPFLHRIYEQIYQLYDQHIAMLPLKFYYLAAPKDQLRRVVFCYPDKPVYDQVLYQICRYSGYIITNKPQPASAVIHFEDRTFRSRQRVLVEIAGKQRVINYRCRDISKTKIDQIQKRVFGYCLAITPLVYKKRYVKKSNLNSLHTGMIMDRPEKPEPGFVYQRLINNIVDGELEEMRIPIIGRQIPFIFLKRRPVRDRCGIKNLRVRLMETAEVLTSAEIEKILQFCRKLGLDQGELDVLRDFQSDRLYIVDANNTPAAPPNHLFWREYRKALHILSAAFEQEFLEKNI